MQLFEARSKHKSAYDDTTFMWNVFHKGGKIEMDTQVDFVSIRIYSQKKQISFENSLTPAHNTSQPMMTPHSCEIYFL